MSETSFDTSAADTLTSGLSLGQCIKNAAEEFHPPESWYELQPTVEKEWHTLQGEPSSRISVVEGDMSELPVSDVSSNSQKQDKFSEFVNPISRLFDHVKVRKSAHIPHIESRVRTHLAGPSSELCTPAVTNRGKLPQLKARGVRISDQYATPALSERPRRQPELDKSSLLSSSSNGRAFSKGSNADEDENILSAQNISDLLEKDDSLAQRVKDLLEEEPIKSDGSDHSHIKELASSNNVPILLQPTPQERHGSKEKQPFRSTTSDQQSDVWHEDRIMLSDTSLCSASDKTVEARVINPSDAPLSTMSIITDSGMDVPEGFKDESSIGGDTLGSLNTSKGTEYGDLPETVDIPQDIMSRLNMMRLASQEPSAYSTTKTPLKQAWSEKGRPFTSNENSELNAPTISLHPTGKNEKYSSLDTKNSHQLNIERSVPISGDVKFYTESNPTTPQFPIEEEKLQQLQKYIEKKTGAPTISPLVPVPENSSQANTPTASVSTSTSVNASTQPDFRNSVPVSIIPKVSYQSEKENKNLAASEGRPSEFSFNCVSSNDSASQQSNGILRRSSKSQGDYDKNLSNSKYSSRLQSPEGGLDSQSSTPQHPDGLKRSEPEGMSPPIVSSAPNSSSIKPGNLASGSGTKLDITTCSTHTSSVSDKPANKEESYLEESLADESLLARIKSALTDSFSQRPAAGSFVCNAASHDALKSDVSFASSIDSLAIQVKALLEEEVPQLINTDEHPQDTSNLSQVIENFEQTDLWKFVAQFLPQAMNESMTIQTPDSNALNENMQAVDDNASLPSVSQTNISLRPDDSMISSTLENSILERIRTELRKSTSFTNQTQCDNQRKTPTPSAVAESPVRYPAQNISRTDMPQRLTEPKYSDIHSSSTSRTWGLTSKDSSSFSKNSDSSNVDPIPGIPAFALSVLPESKESLSSNTEPSELTVTDEAKNLSPQKSFSHCRKNAKSIIASQLNRAAQRNFDVSLTPARHASIFSDGKGREKKENEPSSLSKANEISGSNGEETSQLRGQSAYFRNNGEWSLSVEDTHSTSRHSSELPVPARRGGSPSHRRSPVSGASQRSDVSSRRHRYRNVPYPPQTRGATPPLTSGIVSPRIKSVRSGGSPEKADKPERRVRYSDQSFPTRDKETPSRRSKSKSPLRDRITVFDWLKTPEHKKSLERSKNLPTFDELVAQEANKDEEGIQHHEISEHPLQWSSPENAVRSAYLKNVALPTNLDKSRDGRRTPRPENILHKSLEESFKIQQVPEKDSSHRLINSKPLKQLKDRTNSKFPEKQDSRYIKNANDVKGSSICPQLDTDDSYQRVSFDTAGLPSVVLGSSSKFQEDSDRDVHRRTVNVTSSSETTNHLNVSQSRIPRTLSEFQSLDDKVQHEVLKKILEWANEKRRSSFSSTSRSSKAQEKKHSRTRQTPLHDVSLGSNQAVCDSDSTEYCDLPSTRPATAQTNDNSSQHLLGMDETKAEQVMKRLLAKIQQQKHLEKSERKKNAHKRNTAKSSTPQRSRPPLVVPEASSIASTTDTDAGGRYYVKYRERKHQGQKKIAFIEEISESEPTVIQVKRRHKKHDEGHTPRVVLYDRAVQTASSADAFHEDVSTNFPSPVKRESKKRVSKAVQTASTQSSTSDQQDEDNNLNDTIVIEQYGNDDKENIDSNKKSKQKEFASFYVDMDKKSAKNLVKKAEGKVPLHKSVAWYEPFQYEPPWLPPSQKQDTAGLLRIGLQEALATQNPKFISKLRERQRRITINADERRLQEIWAEERQRVFGTARENKVKRRSAPSLPVRRSLTMTRKQIVAETRNKYEQLPEVVKRKREEERRKEYATHRLKAQLYKKKIQNKVLGRYFMS